MYYRIHRTRSGICGAAAKFDSDGRTGCEAAVLRQTPRILQGKYNMATLRMLGYKSRGITQVAWIYMERSAILTVQNHVITRNPRISVSHDQHHTWNLHIASIQESDRGGYMQVLYHFKLFIVLTSYCTSSCAILGARSTRPWPKCASATSPSSVSARPIIKLSLVVNILESDENYEAPGEVDDVCSHNADDLFSLFALRRNLTVDGAEGGGNFG